MKLNLLYFMLLLTFFQTACSTDYSDNNIVSGTQTIYDDIKISSMTTSYTYRLKEESNWKIIRQEGDSLLFEKETGDARTPVVFRIKQQQTGKSKFEMLHATGTTVQVDVQFAPEQLAGSLKVFQLNVWQEGTMVSGGYDAIVDEIVRSEADFITLSEVRNYSNVNFTQKVINSLKEKGLTYYSSRSDDSGVLSKYPVKEFKAIYPYEHDAGTIYKLVAEVNNCRIAVYGSHLDYTHYACYLPRGYDGISFSKLSQPVTDIQRIRQMNLASARDEQIEAFIADATQERQNGALVILGGDFNEPSHLDWNYDTKDLYDHNGVVYNWDQSLTLQQAGFVDSYRSVYPSAVTHPGFTYPSDNPDAAISSLTWAPDVDERERIDFLYFYPDVRWELRGAKVVGPDGTIVNGQRTPSDSQDVILLPVNKWPSDHKGLFIEFDMKGE